ncbi:MAG: hypothetical protein KC478_16105 [Bacteriovoracaceae bacterium]|nr:hypothetical protein [Bacteriovoracaceae bacterium]
MIKLLTLFLISFSSWGSVLFEPYYGMSFSGELEESSTEALFTGPSYGAKFGAQYMGLFGGFDYRLGTFSVDAKEEGTSLEDETLDLEMYYAFVGYEFPAFFKVWAGLGIGGGADSPGLEFSDASGSLLGVGYKGFPVISLNLEYMSWKYDEVDPGSESDLEGQNFLVSVSIPINF